MFPVVLKRAENNITLQVCSLENLKIPPLFFCLLCIQPPEECFAFTCFAHLHSWIFPLKETALGGLWEDTTAASFYCSPARRHCSVITCLRPLFAQICPHFQLWKTPWKHISYITKQNLEDVDSTHCQMFLAEQPQSKIESYIQI